MLTETPIINQEMAEWGLRPGSESVSSSFYKWKQRRPIELPGLKHLDQHCPTELSRLKHLAPHGPAAPSGRRERFSVMGYPIWQPPATCGQPPRHETWPLRLKRDFQFQCTRKQRVWPLAAVLGSKVLDSGLGGSPTQDGHPASLTGV